MELHSDLNYIRVRSFILNGAPFKSKHLQKITVREDEIETVFQTVFSAGL
jgi:hypothetical protein